MLLLCVVYTIVVSVGTHSLTWMWSQKAAFGELVLILHLVWGRVSLLSTDVTVSCKLTGLCTSASCLVSAFHLKVGVPSLQICAITWVPGGSRLRPSGLHGKPLPTDPSPVLQLFETIYFLTMVFSLPSRKKETSHSSWLLFYCCDRAPWPKQLLEELIWALQFQRLTVRVHGHLGRGHGRQAGRMAGMVLEQ